MLNVKQGQSSKSQLKDCRKYRHKPFLMRLLIWLTSSGIFLVKIACFVSQKPSFRFSVNGFIKLDFKESVEFTSVNENSAPEGDCQ